MARGIRQKDLKEGWAEVDGLLYFQGLLYLPEIIRTEIISKHHDDPLAEYFGIEMTRELVAQKYYLSTLRADINTYVRGCDVCLALKAVRYKLYGDLQSLPVPIHRWKNVSINFIIGLPVSTNWKFKTYNSILVIVDRFTKIIHYKPIKITIDAPGLAEVLIDIIVRQYGLLDSIVSD